MKALLLIAHGSNRQISNDEIRTLTEHLKEKAQSDFEYINCVFLELAEPSIGDGVEQCIAAGAEEITLVPYFLSEGKHVATDIPEIVAQKQKEHPNIKMYLSTYLGNMPEIEELLLRIATGSENAHTIVEKDPIKRHLILVGGHICALLGLIALLLPIVPTSPFLVVAAACYARSSPRFRQLLISNRYCGPAILKWEKNRCLDARVKYLFVGVLAVAFLTSTVIFMETWLAKFIVLTLGISAITYVALLPTCNDD